MMRTTASGWKWLLRWGMICAGVLGITAAAWAWWRAECNRRAEAILAQVNAHCGGLKWDELPYDDVPDQLNAATYLREVWAATTNPTGPATTQQARTVGWPKLGTPGWQAFAESAVAANTQMLALARQARPYTRICWGRPAPGGSRPPVPMFTNTCTCARVLLGAMILHHQRKEDHEAIECWRDIDFQARMVCKNSYILIAGLVGVIDSGLGAEGMLVIAPELQFDRPGQVDRADARRLIRELLDAKDPQEATTRGLHLEASSYIASGVAGVGATPWLLRPGFRLGMATNAAVIDDAAQACEALRDVPPRPLFYERDSLLAGCVIPQFTSVGKDVAFAAMKRRLAAMVVAIRLYQHEQGRYPDHLDQLVPEYLPEIPKDLRNEEKTPLGYLLTSDGQRPLLYSAAGTSDTAAISRAIPKTRASLVGSSTPLPNGIIWQDASNWGSTASTSQPAGLR